MSSRATQPVDSRLAFRRACSQYATGITAVTACDSTGALVALTANSFTSVSLEPPLVSVCIGRHLPSLELLRRSKHAAIHVLTEAEEEVARLFATAGVSGADRLAGLSWEPGLHGEPLLQDCAARLSGPIYDQVVAGDHVILIVEVASTYIQEPETPTLIFHRGRFLSSAGLLP